MSTSVFINSLVRYDKNMCEQSEPNPFEFTVPASQTSKWSMMKTTPHSNSAYRESGGYEIHLDALTIPASVLSTPEPMILVEIVGQKNIDYGHMTRVRCNNNLCQQIIDPSSCNCGATYILCVDSQGCTGSYRETVCMGNIGCTGVTTAPTFTRCKNSTKSNLNNTWVGYLDCTTTNAAGTTTLFYVYKSHSRVSVERDSWYGCQLNFKVLDSCGNVLEPDNFDCNNVCNYARLFCKENQVLTSFTFHFVPSSSNFGPGCFSDNK